MYASTPLESEPEWLPGSRAAVGTALLSKNAPFISRLRLKLPVHSSMIAGHRYGTSYQVPGTYTIPVSYVQIRTYKYAQQFESNTLVHTCVLIVEYPLPAVLTPVSSSPSCCFVRAADVCPSVLPAEYVCYPSVCNTSI